MFQRLSKLQIIECPKLALPCLPSLKELNVQEKCNQDLLSSIHNLRSLESLALQDNEELTSFPDGILRDLTSLKILRIFRYSKLEVFPTEIIPLNAIQELWIDGCDSLESLTDEVLQGLRSLKVLRIGWNHKFKLSTGFQYLTSLEDLGIDCCPEVEGFPEALQHMTALQSLSLYNLPNLGSLPDWLGNLGLLHDLSISKCPKLTCLPMSIQCLSGLERLEIYSCPELEKRCQKETGEDWPKIAHVLHIFISESGSVGFIRDFSYDENHRDL